MKKREVYSTCGVKKRVTIAESDSKFDEETWLSAQHFNACQQSYNVKSLCPLERILYMAASVWLVAVILLTIGNFAVRVVCYHYH